MTVFSLLLLLVTRIHVCRTGSDTCCDSNVQVSRNTFFRAGFLSFSEVMIGSREAASLLGESWLLQWIFWHSETFSVAHGLQAWSSRLSSWAAVPLSRSGHWHWSFKDSCESCSGIRVGGRSLTFFNRISLSFTCALFPFIFIITSSQFSWSTPKFKKEFLQTLYVSLKFVCWNLIPSVMIIEGGVLGGDEVIG